MNSVFILGARGEACGAAEFMQQVQSLPCDVLPMDADRVCGKAHLEAAVIHAKRAMEQGTNASTTVSMETMLFASGERQISKAKEKMGVKDGMRHFALVLFDCDDPSEVLRRLKLIKDDLVLLPSKEKAVAFGIDRDELKTVPEGQWADLVLERVAFVEILKR
ncbi:MAG TPA: KEOPS complex subunit Cgi121 [Methanomassiliicoccales archaeon]|jgi:KEOPS complex subunit Cgi121